MKLNFSIGVVKDRIADYRRVLQVARKPSMDEFKKTAKVCGAGMMAIGVIGFATYAASVLLIG